MRSELGHSPLLQEVGAEVGRALPDLEQFDTVPCNCFCCILYNTKNLLHR